VIDTMSVAPVTSFRDTLVRHRLLIPTGARGVYGFGSAFDRVLQRLDALITRVSPGNDRRRAHARRLLLGVSLTRWRDASAIRATVRRAGRVLPARAVR